MNHKKNLTNFADQLVSDHAKYEKTDGFYTLNVHDLPPDEREEFTRLYLEAKDRDLDLVMESVRNGDFKIDSEYNCALLSMLKNNNEENRQHFAHTVISNVLVYFESELQEVLNQSCADYGQMLDENAGFSE